MTQALIWKRCLLWLCGLAAVQLVLIVFFTYNFLGAIEQLQKDRATS